MTTLYAPDDVRIVKIPGWNRKQVLAVWAAAALPMALLSWVVAPLLSRAFSGPAALPQAVIVSLTAGLVWQFVLVLVLVHREQGSLSWPVLREALWLRAPRRPGNGRRGGLLWLVLVPCTLLFGAEELIIAPSAVTGHDLPAFLQSAAGAAVLSGSWAWFGLIVVMTLFNTVLGEELLFRGLLLPRMGRAFGRGDWVANGILFAVYHLHMPWAIPTDLLDTFALALPSRRYRSALIGIIVHSTQTVTVIVLTAGVVFR